MTITTCAARSARDHIWRAVTEDRRLLLAVARRRLIDRSAAEDVIHDAAVRAIGRLDRRPVSSADQARGELVRLVAWRAGEVNRGRRRVEPCRAPEDRRRWEAADSDPVDPADALAVREALASLPAPLVATVALRYGRDLTWDEVARHTDCDWKQAAGRGARALAGLRRRLA